MTAASQMPTRRPSPDGSPDPSPDSIKGPRKAASTRGLRPNLQCHRKSPLGIIQLRFAPIVGVANIDGIGIQSGQFGYPHWKGCSKRMSAASAFRSWVRGA